MGKWYLVTIVCIALIFGMGYYERRCDALTNEIAVLDSQVINLEAQLTNTEEELQRIHTRLCTLESAYNQLYFESAQLAIGAQSLYDEYTTVASENEVLCSRLEARVLNLSEYEFDVACSITMGEAGGESDRGVLLLAQALVDGCIRNGVTPSQLRNLYQYQGYNPNYSERVAAAVDAVFNKGYRVVDDTLLYMYNPSMASSPWHESQTFVTQEGNVRFFK